MGVSLSRIFSRSFASPEAITTNVPFGMVCPCFGRSTMEASFWILCPLNFFPTKLSRLANFGISISFLKTKEINVSCGAVKQPSEASLSAAAELSRGNRNRDSCCVMGKLNAYQGYSHWKLGMWRVSKPMTAHDNASFNRRAQTPSPTSQTCQEKERFMLPAFLRHVDVKLAIRRDQNYQAPKEKPKVE